MELSDLEIQGILKKFVSEELLNNGSTINSDDNLLLDGMVDSLGFLLLIRPHYAETSLFCK